MQAMGGEDLPENVCGDVCVKIVLGQLVGLEECQHAVRGVYRLFLIGRKVRGMVTPGSLEVLLEGTGI